MEQETEVILVRPLDGPCFSKDDSVEKLIDMANAEIGVAGAYFKLKPRNKESRIKICWL